MREVSRRQLLTAAGAALGVVLIEPTKAFAGGTLLDYIKGRSDLSRRGRARWAREIKLRFGGSALEEETERRPEVMVAKSILSAAIFMNTNPKKAAMAAWEGWHGALGAVPPPIAIHYQILTLEGRRPRGRPIDLAFHFPDYYNEEIAPDLVAYWEKALANGKIQDVALRETKEALAATRLKMRPLLLDKLRLLARLARDRSVASGGRRAEIDKDIRALEKELKRSFSRVARRPEVIDSRKRPFDRLRIQLEDMGLKLSAEDRYLNPNGPPPPPREAPKIEPPPPPPPGKEPPLSEPALPPLPPVPKQPRPGMRPKLQKLEQSLGALTEAYEMRLRRLIDGWLGTPYRWGNATRGVGTDCSGFTRSVFSGCFGLTLPRVSRDQFRVGRSIPRKGLRPGDLVFFDTMDAGRITHVGIYLGRERFAHASSSRGVVYDKLTSRYYRRAYRGARRVLVYP